MTVNSAWRNCKYISLFFNAIELKYTVALKRNTQVKVQVLISYFPPQTYWRAIGAHKQRVRDTLAYPACQYEICRLPGDLSCLTSVVTGSWCFIRSHTYPRTPFLVTVSHYPLFQHIMDRLQLEYLVLKVFSEGALPHFGTVVLAMYH